MRTRLALPTLLAGTLVLGAVASAQAVPGAWDIIVTVRKDNVGADLVTVGARSANYPPDLLRSQIVALGERLGGNGSRGISVQRVPIQPNDPATTVVRGTFAVDGLIDAKTGHLAIPPIAQAFAGAPEPFTVQRMLVSFDGVRIRPGVTMAYHTTGKNSDLYFKGRPVGSSIEYDVELRSQDPARLVISAAAAPPKASEKSTAQSSAPIDPFAIALYGLAAIAAGALVYCGLLMVGRRPSNKS